jgi:hypothetical protein
MQPSPSPARPPIAKECLGGESNPYAPLGAPDFKSGASASSATQAFFFSMNHDDARSPLFDVACLVALAERRV